MSSPASGVGTGAAPCFDPQERFFRTFTSEAIDTDERSGERSVMPEALKADWPIRGLSGFRERHASVADCRCARPREPWVAWVLIRDVPEVRVLYDHPRNGPITVCGVAVHKPEPRNWAHTELRAVDERTVPAIEQGGEPRAVLRSGSAKVEELRVHMRNMLAKRLRLVKPG